jgi:hypothetical protein
VASRTCICILAELLSLLMGTGLSAEPSEEKINYFDDPFLQDDSPKTVFGWKVSDGGSG